MSLLAPELKRSRLALGELYQLIGHRLYPGEWRGDEFRAPVTVPYEQAVHMKAEEQQHRLWLEERKHPSNDEFVRQCLALNEMTGFLDLDAAYEPEGSGQLRHVIGKLDSSVEYFSACPPLDDRAAYNAQVQAHERNQTVRRQLRALLEDGRIVATCAGKQTSESIAAELWGAEHVEFDVEAGSASVGVPCRQLLRLQFTRADLDKLLKRSLPSLDKKREVEQAVKIRLIHMMLTEDRSEKSAVFKRIESEGHSISKRAFDRQWTAACQETRSGWDHPGALQSPD